MPAPTVTPLRSRWSDPPQHHQASPTEIQDLLDEHDYHIEPATAPPGLPRTSLLTGASPSGVGRPDRRTSNLRWRIPYDRPACQPRGLGAVGQCSMELQAGADLELGEDLAQVVLDGARADEQPGGDLRVRQPVAG